MGACKKKTAFAFCADLEINQNHGRSEMRFINGIKWEVLQKKRILIASCPRLSGNKGRNASP